MTGRPISRRNRVFIDTSAYFALINENDSSHVVAREAAMRLSVERKHIFTSNFVIAKTHALVLRKLGRDVAFRVLTELDRSNATIVRVSSADERRARDIIAQFRDKSFSLTDATSFAIMDRLKIGQAFSFDDDCAQYGFMVVGETPGADLAGHRSPPRASRGHLAPACSR